MNTDIKKFGYKPMAMRLAESSEILDERIDEFMSIIQKHHNLDDSAFGNAAAQGTNEIVAVGRIASDTAEGKLNSASLVLETSRRVGAGIRVPLKIDALTTSWQFFPGQIVALRGINASGAYFTVSEVLQTPLLPVPGSSIQSIDAVNERLGVSNESAGQPLNIMFASGPYTAEDNLDFEPLQALCSKAADEMVDALVLTGPFLDIEHPLLATGDFDLPEAKGADSDATLNTAFRLWISTPLQRLCSAVPSITIILVPSVRDAVSKHVSWPQDQLLKKDLGLGLAKQVKTAPNPCTISLNETVIGISSQDILYELSREQVSGGGGGQDLMTRLPRFLIEQRHFFPLFPPVSRHQLPKGSGPKATGACLDLGYPELGEWLNVRPDVLVVPSMLTPSVKVRLWRPPRSISCRNFANHASATGG
jgi:DNA polymerase alpha subunit B